MLERRPHAEHLGIRLPMHGADEPVAVRAADARAVRHVRLVQANPARCVERVQAGRLEVVRELLDPRLVRDGGVRIGRARESLRGVLAVGAMHLVVVLGLRVVRLELVVRDRPRGRDAVVVLQLAEVLGAQAVERCAVELGRPAHEVVDLGLERLAVAVVPHVLGDVAVVDEHVLGEPVLGLARQPVAALQEQDALPRRCEVARQRAAAGAGSDDDHVVRVH